ncbi:hypothetical protein Droror1_Dr00027918 [Drosera rotundifolia]
MSDGTVPNHSISQRRSGVGAILLKDERPRRVKPRASAVLLNDCLLVSDVFTFRAMTLTNVNGGLPSPRSLGGDLKTTNGVDGFVQYLQAIF